MRLSKNLSFKINLQCGIVSLCLLGICIATQRIQTVKWDSGIIEFSRDSLGVLIAVILLTHYKWLDFIKYKIPYLIWTITGLISGLVFTPMVIAHREDYLLADTIVIGVGIFLMGYCCIHTCITFFIEKYRPKLYLPLFIIWVVMLIWMICSKSDYLWPECYFVLFFCYYLTPQTSKQRSNVTNGMINGIILGFIAIQAHSLLCRPYDVVRYYGNFCNPNHNCMFLCICLSAILIKILLLTKKKQKWFCRLPYYLLSGACYSLIFMTQSRSGYLATFAITVCFLIGYSSIQQKIWFIRMGLCLVLLFATMLPITYLAVRYIPTIRPHVVFYFQEGYSEDRVHSWDSRDSQKYVSFEELMSHLFWRFRALKITNTFSNPKTFPIPQEHFELASLDYFPPSMLIQLAQINSQEIDSNKIPALVEAEADPYRVRYTIYKWYWDHLSLRGMPYDEQGFQLTESHWIQDTHNIYLDYGINFGYPAMILFAIFIWWGIGRLIRQGLRTREVEKWAALLIAIIPPVFGMFEFAWGPGMLSTVALYLSFKEILRK